MKTDCTTEVKERNMARFSSVNLNKVTPHWWAWVQWQNSWHWSAVKEGDHTAVNYRPLNFPLQSFNILKIWKTACFPFHPLFFFVWIYQITPAAGFIKLHSVCARDFVQPITIKALFQTGLNISDSTEPVSLLDRKPHTVFFFFLKDLNLMSTCQ